MKKIGELGGKWSFWTVTMPSWVHKLKSEEERAKTSLQQIRQNWDKLFKFMKRKFGKFEYVRVFETHESGTLHIHFLAAFHVPDDDYKTVIKEGKKKYSYCASMKDSFLNYGFGYMHSVENLPENDFALTVGYVTKYMTKEDDFVSKHLKKSKVRRIQTSRKIGAVPKNSSAFQWTLVTGVSIYEAKEMETFDLNIGRVVRDADFAGEHWYPTFEERRRKNRLANDEPDEKA